MCAEKRSLYDQLLCSPGKPKEPPAKRARINGPTRADLCHTIHERRVLLTKGELAKMTKDELVALAGPGPIPKAPPPVPTPLVTLDADQRAFAEGLWTCAIAVSGPGAGKSTTLCYLAARHKHQRVLVLTYTNAGIAAIKTRLRAQGHTCNRSKVNAGNTGIHVVTFNSYAAHRAQKSHGSFSRGGGSSGGFDDALMRHSQLGVQPEWEVWDLVLVDEAQDVVLIHEKLLEQIKGLARRFALVGDPRQELYPGATFFTRACLSGDYTMYYLTTNYRSSPEVVHMLNVFSRAHFPPQLHADQISAHTSVVSDAAVPAIQLVVLEDLKSLYTAAAHALGTCEDCALISPVSIDRFKTSEITLGVQQVLHTEYGRIAKVVSNKLAAGRPAGDRTVVMGNACTVKGLEYPRCGIVQTNISYEAYGISLENYKRKLYVSLSRAKESVILFFIGPPTHPLLEPLCKLVGLTMGRPALGPPLRTLRRELSVTQDFCTRCSFPVTTTLLAQLEPLEVTSAECPAYLGVYVEKQLAQKMGAPLPSRIQFEPYQRGMAPRMSIFPDGAGEHILSIVPYSRQAAPELEVLQQPGGLTWPALAKAEYSLTIAQTWTLGETVEPHDYATLDRYVEYFPPAVASSVHRMLHIMGHRSHVKLGILWGITDIETEEQILEIKHAEPCEAYAVQAATYNLLDGGRPGGALLVNTKTGDIEQVVAEAPLDLYARALLGIIHAGQCRDERRVYAIASEPLVVAVDIETSGSSVFEVGAVAFMRGTNTIVSVFHELAAGIVPDISSPEDPDDSGSFSVEKLCGVSLSGVESLERESARLISAFQAWCAKLPPHTVLKWGGSDDRVLCMEMMDMCTRYRAHLQLVGCSASGASLSDAVETLSAGVENNGGIFVPHRAYEDAIALMIVFTALAL